MSRNDNKYEFDMKGYMESEYYYEHLDIVKSFFSMVFGIKMYVDEEREVNGQTHIMFMQENRGIENNIDNAHYYSWVWVMASILKGIVKHRMIEYMQEESDDIDGEC